LQTLVCLTFSSLSVESESHQSGSSHTSAVGVPLRTATDDQTITRLCPCSRRTRTSITFFLFLVFLRSFIISFVRSFVPLPARKRERNNNNNNVLLSPLFSFALSSFPFPQHNNNTTHQQINYQIYRITNQIKSIKSTKQPTHREDRHKLIIKIWRGHKTNNRRT